MPRSVAPALLILTVFAWLTAGLLVAALATGVLIAGLPDGDPRGTTLILASVLLGGAVAVVGATATYGLLRRRSERAGTSLPWTTPRGTSMSSAVAPNTLRGDATRRPPGMPGRAASPAPPAPRPGMAPAPGRQPSAPGRRPSVSAPPPPPGRGAAGGSGSGRWTSASRGAAPRSRAPIPGAQTVPSSAAGKPTASQPTAGQWEAAPGRALPVAEALALIAGVLLLDSANWASVSPWLLPVLLLVVSGAIASGSGSGLFGASIREALLAALPLAVVSAVAVAGGTGDLESALVRVVLLFIGAWVAVNVGMVGAGFVGSSRT
jgi:hypothetical protein